MTFLVMEEDAASVDCIGPMVRLQKQMKIMNRNLTGKLEEMNGMQNVDTHVALSGQLQMIFLKF